MAKDTEYKNKIPTNRYEQKYSSLTRDIKIFMPIEEDDCTKDEGNKKRNEGDEDLHFVGRERVSERLYNWLSASGRGSYLVTGFRGMGKTTIVERTIQRLTKELNPTCEIKFKFLLLAIPILAISSYIPLLCGNGCLSIIIGIVFLLLLIISPIKWHIGHTKKRESPNSKNDIQRKSYIEDPYSNRSKKQTKENVSKLDNIITIFTRLKKIFDSLKTEDDELSENLNRLIPKLNSLNIDDKELSKKPNKLIKKLNTLIKKLDSLIDKLNSSGTNNEELNQKLNSLIEELIEILKFWNEYPKYDKRFLDRLIRGNRIDDTTKEYSNIKITVNLGHEVLKERDILGLIATSIRDEYKKYINSIRPRWIFKVSTVALISLLGVALTWGTKEIVSNTITHTKNNTYNYITYQDATQSNECCPESDNWFSRTAFNTIQFCGNLYYYKYKDDNGKNWGKWPCLLGIFVVWFFLIRKLIYFTVKQLPYWGTPFRAIKRLDLLSDRIVATTDEESGGGQNIDKGLLSISLFGQRRHKTLPIANIREIETELSSIINDIADNCSKYYRARFFIVFDEMDKIDPALVEQPHKDEMPEFTDSVKGFPDGMDSRVRRRNVLKLLANIKLFVNTAKAKFVFISGRELYDAYLADLSDRDFAISSIFNGVLNVDSFLTPEGGQTDVRSMSEWYIANRLIPREWLKEKENDNAVKNHILKQEKPSLKWYYEYLITECTNRADAAYIIGFLHIFAAYLTHISNGSPKKISLYFEKYIRKDSDCLPMNDWQDVCIVGERKEKQEGKNKDCEQKVLFFDSIQQRTINFVYYLANPIMGTITNDLSNYGDRFLVSLSFIIDHIYKHHSRSFSWRNMEQIPDLLKTSKAPELRDSVTSLMEYLTQIHISPVLIGLNEYKFHKSIAEEISVISKLSDEASAIFNFTLDESMSVIQHNTQLLNYYREMEHRKNTDGDGSEWSNDKYQPIIARIHSNLGDLHYWDEDYYAASLEYRAAIEVLPNKRGSQSSFLTKMRCMLKLGLTYEMRKLYPNAYQIYCNLIEDLISQRWIEEEKFGLSVLDTYVADWRGKQQTLVYPAPSQGKGDLDEKYTQQFKINLYNGKGNYEYMTNVDGVISSFANNLTREKSEQVNKLTLFEEIRYVYQSILAKLSILEKMGMSGITQTNIDVAEGEFIAIHKSVNIREKFIISADFFRKLAEILYYKNSLTILSQNQDSLYASVYYGDYDLLAHLDDYCMYGTIPNNSNALEVKHDVKFFFNWMNSEFADKDPKFSYKKFKGEDGKTKKSFKALFEELKEYVSDSNVNHLLSTLSDQMKANVNGFLDYNIDKVTTNESEIFFFGSLDYCDFHRHNMRKNNLRPACYACKYYTRSLRILAANMFENKDVLQNNLTKSLGVLNLSFKKYLLYTNSNSIKTLAQTLEGFGNVMFACASGNKYEHDNYKSDFGINPHIISAISKLLSTDNDEQAETIIQNLGENLEGSDGKNKAKLSRLDKSILYYFDAYRFYLINADYNEAVGCLKKITTILTYYIEVLCYYPSNSNNPFNDESETIRCLLYGNSAKQIKPVLDELFRHVARYTGYKYDHINISEINELKWIYSKELCDNIDLTKLSVYPDIRSCWLRIAEIKTKGLKYLMKNEKDGQKKKGYTESYLTHIRDTYPLIAPKRRNETTFYEEVLAYYTKVRYNDHILNNLLGRNPFVNREKGGYTNEFHIEFYKLLAGYLNSGEDNDRIDKVLFDTACDVEDRLHLIEYLILDTLNCISNMVKVFTPHNHLTSYSKSFIAIVYNFYWEWARKYEFLYSLYQYQESIIPIRYTDMQDSEENESFNCFYFNKPFQNNNEYLRYNPEKANKIIKNIAGGIRSEKTGETIERELRDAMTKCARIISNIPFNKEEILRFGLRSDRLYERLRHEIDDITINTIFSNYTAEMALRNYKLSEEANTEGEAYTEMISSLHFLNDDLNNDTCQFNIACDRFLLNCGVVEQQRKELEKLYCVSNVYDLNSAYITGPNKLENTITRKEDLIRSNYLNSEYL